MNHGALTHGPALHPPAFTWTPDQASGATLKGFIDFEDNTKITTASGAVSQIVDSVSAAAFVQATAGSRPALITSAGTGRQVASFDGVDDYLNIESIPTGWPTGANPVELVVVSSQTDSAVATRYALSYGGAATNSSYRLGRAATAGPAVARFQGGNGTTTFAADLSDILGWHVVRGKATGTDIYVETDGVISPNTALVPAIGTTRARIGVVANTLASFWKGEISAILVYAGALSQQDLNNLYIWSRIRMGV